MVGLKKEMKECPVCGSEVEADAAYCPECGTDFDSDSDDVDYNY